MQTTNRRPFRGLALLGGLMLIVAACSGGGASTSAGAPSDAAPTGGAPSDAAPSAAAPSEAMMDLSGATFTVGSKEFTEQLILGQITKLVLEDHGATVDDQTGLVGSKVVREALVSGEIDMYWEYTGTGWITHLGNTTPVVGSQEQFDAVKEADAANDIVWVEPAPFNNTYSIALSNEKATELGVSKLSDLAALPPASTTLCAAAEFLGRDDGLPGLEQAYGVKFSDVSELELGLVYTSIDKSDPCIFGEAFATDGRIAALGLTVLADDKDFFPSYLPALNIRKEVFDANPGLAELFAPVAAALDTATMQDLNSKVDVDGMQPADVAAEFLKSQGLMGG
ncbi:MAG: glycine betaine ABC transporter substrate-binding protein [Chloroflexi bacterium]|nr:glycine betaine ABC transporter substrate-binding protein [Chloroflexota bacterium]